MTLDTFLIFKHHEWKEVLTFQGSTTQSVSHYWPPWTGWNTQWSSTLVRIMPPHTPNTTHTHIHTHTHTLTHTHTHTVVVSSDSCMGQRTYMPFEIKNTWQLKNGSIFSGIFCMRMLKSLSKSFGVWDVEGGSETLVYNDSWIIFTSSPLTGSMEIQLNGPFQENILKGESPGFSNLWHRESCGWMVKKKCLEWPPGPGLKQLGEGWCHLLRWEKLREDGLWSITFFLLKEKVAVLECSVSCGEETTVWYIIPIFRVFVPQPLNPLLALP